MEDIQIILERHDQNLKSVQKQIDELRKVHTEIRTMNETLVTLANEIKHTNEHLSRHEEKIEKIENQPKDRMNQLYAAVVAALAGGLISAAISAIIMRI